MENNNTSTFSEIINLLDSIIWPVIILVILSIYKKKIPELIRSIGGKVKKISIANLFELELALVNAAVMNWPSGHTPDLRQPTKASEFTSYAPSLIQELNNETTGEYAIIDLGIGKSWLASRLFIIVTLLKQTKGLEYYVFLETTGGVQNKFIGITNSDTIRWAFAMHYPWFEESYIKAYLEREINDPSSPKPGIITVEQAGIMVTKFLEEIQNQLEPPLVYDNEWLPVGSEGYYEHSKWITSNLLFEVFSDDLKTDCITNASEQKQEEKLNVLLNLKGKYVAVIDNRGEFKSLIDREVAVTDFAKKAIKQE
jgi:hypothetical protein